jgi:putative polyhydroxyalkanoate system protein
MPNLTVSIPHQLSRAEAKRRIQEQIAHVQQQYGGMVGPVEQAWEGDTLDLTLSAAGQTVAGRLMVEDQAVRVEVALPWMLSLLAGKVQQQVEEQGRRLLEERRPASA